jgi:hypothetical protein
MVACRLMVALVLAGIASDVAARDLSARATEFMDAYARDLAVGERAAIAARYSGNGVILLSAGKKHEFSLAKITEQYATTWKPPASFQWRNLSYASLGDESVLVSGEFLWTVKSGGEPVVYSYAAILALENGALRIRLEDETPQAMPCAK